VEGVTAGRGSAARDAARVPFLDLRRRTAAMGPQLREAVGRVADSGVVLWGPEIEAFEREWADYAGRRHALAVASGTEALRLALVSLDVGPGDEVLMPAFTAIPTAAAICATGATPVPVDVEPQTATLDAEAARVAQTAQTKAAIVVHLYGRPARIPELDVPVVEDAAHAHGGLDGLGGVAAAYSFYPTKNLGGIGDGGAVVTDDDAIAERVRRLRAHGQGADGSFEEISTNSRLSELEAAALRIGLRGLDEGNRRRAEIAAAYRQAAPGLSWQPDHPMHTYHLCVARPEDRERFRAEMPFETAVHYPRIVTDQPAYSKFHRVETPAASEWAARCVSLPCYPEMTDEEVESVCAALP
jgi:dTDP-4-amino-4,6-dideoxygalactose transaminase